MGISDWLSNTAASLAAAADTVAPAPAPAPAPRPVAPTATPAPPPPPAPTRSIPPGGVYFVTETGQQGVYYDVHGNRFVYYFDGASAAATGGLGAPRRVASSSLAGATRSPVQELWGIASGSPGKTYQQHADSMLLMLTGGNREAMSDPAVVRLALLVASGQIGQQEFEVRLRQTAFYQTRTDIQREWSNLAGAEQRQRIEIAAAELVGMWFQNTGQQISVTDARIQNAALRIASGTLTRGQWLETVVKPEALRNPESPWARTIRDEIEAQRQRGIDIENRTQQIQELYDRWGVPVTPGTASDWAKKIVENLSSEADLITHLQQQAKILYPWKDLETETRTAAEPWLQTYARVLERPVPDLRDADVQKALTAGVPIYEFEQQLKSKSEWLTTKNAMESMTQTASKIGAIMGYN